MLLPLLCGPNYPAEYPVPSNFTGDFYDQGGLSYPSPNYSVTSVKSYDTTRYLPVPPSSCTLSGGDGLYLLPD